MALFAVLTTTAQALDAQRYGLDVVGNNLANLNTPGYARRVVDFGTVPPVDKFSAGGGVHVIGVRAQRDRLLDRRLFDELPLEQRQASTLDTLRLAEIALGAPGASLDGALANFFDAFAELADTSTLTPNRERVLSEAEALTSVFRTLSGRLAETERSTDARVPDDVERLNGLTSRLASVNRAVARAPEEGRLHLRDEQITLAAEIAGIIGVQVLELADGTFQLATDTGRPLVIGEAAYPLTTSSAPPLGHARILAAGVDITTELRAGSIGGLLTVRDQAVPGYRAQLDTLAFDLATAVNALHASGYDASGAPGGAFFVQPATVAGAAAGLRVDPTLRSDSTKIAAAGVPSSGDNGVARQLANLRDVAVSGGRTPGDAWTALVYRVGSDVHQASRELSSRREIVHQIESLRDSVSGVSVDEEAAMLTRFQRAYEANARFFSVIDDVLETLLSIRR